MIYNCIQNKTEFLLLIYIFHALHITCFISLLGNEIVFHDDDLGNLIQCIKIKFMKLNN